MRWVCCVLRTRPVCGLIDRALAVHPGNCKPEAPAQLSSDLAGSVVNVEMK